jgi:hypothetical protein
MVLQVLPSSTATCHTIIAISQILLRKVEVITTLCNMLLQLATCNINFSCTTSFSTSQLAIVDVVVQKVAKKMLLIVPQL